MLESDNEALKVLEEAGCKMKEGGTIILPRPLDLSKHPLSKIWAAHNYLCDEWDYCSEWEKEEK